MNLKELNKEMETFNIEELKEKIAVSEERSSEVKDE